MQNNSNKNWENKGWEAMQQMLEKELPVEEKESRRRFLFWYWAAGVAVLIGITFFNLNRLDSNLIFDKITEASADISSVGSKGFFDGEKELKIEEKISQTIDNQRFIKKENTPIFEQKESTQKNKNELELTEKPELIKNKSIVNTKFEPSIFDKIASSEAAAQLTKSSNAFSEKADENKRFIQNEKLADLSNLPLLFAGLNLSKIELPEAPKPTFQKRKRIERRKKKAKPVFGLSAGITSDIALSAHGFQAGAFVDFPLKNQKFALQTGINYRLTRQREIRQNWTWGSQDNGDFEMSITDNGGFTIDTSGTANQSEGISSNYYYDIRSNQIQSFQYSNYHTLSVPLSLKYKIHPKWDVLLGAEVSMLLNFLKSNPSAQLNDQALPATEKFTTFKLKNFDLGGVAAVSFKPSKQWQLNLKYHHGNLIQGNNWQVDNRFLSLGGSFLF